MIGHTIAHYKTLGGATENESRRMAVEKCVQGRLACSVGGSPTVSVARQMFKPSHHGRPAGLILPSDGISLAALVTVVPSAS